MYTMLFHCQEFIHEKYEEMVVVESVAPNTPAALADIKKVL